MRINSATMALEHTNVPDRKGDWITVYTGNKYFPLDPRPEEVHIEDIAHSLAMLCRYNGHSKYFYSVAEHCVHVSYAVPDVLALKALLHDAAEAYTSDIPRPLKYADELGLFRDIEELNTQVIYKKFNIDPQYSKEVKEADERILKNEGEILLPKSDWYEHLQRLDNIKIQCWSPIKAEQMYLQRFYELTK